eukprot:TRINITY_DN676_c0_g1_i1.p2 TRINITY_DN676_c0_g1~~TRINITY_DN676_c0_g1_i1.p2  ORF type:complete len:71 (+),score=7.16 TRINITY_DN676_c0_g1_i1:513-725(+)
MICHALDICGEKTNDSSMQKKCIQGLKNGISISDKFNMQAENYNSKRKGHRIGGTYENFYPERTSLYAHG